MYIKTGGQTWTAIRKSYVKTSTGWRKVFDTASNRPFIAGNDIPKIRLNTFRTGSSYNPAGTADDPVDPVVEAPPVQQMGPSWTSPTYGWPYESLGRHLWGYDGTWTSGNGSSMTFTYTWLYNLTGNSNDNTAELNATSTTGRTDMLTNLSSHLGQSDGDYFDKNFLTFRVTATNSAGNASAESAPVYIVREVPTGSITMVSPTLAFTNSSMSATFTYSNNWYNKTNTSNSYIEWFAVDNLGDSLTNANRVQIETLSSIAVSGTTSKSGTTSHVPTIASKYYYVKMTLNNSGTQNAVIAITGFTPKSSVTSQSNKTVVTGAVLDPQPFNTISYVKNFPSSGSGGVVRSTSLSWNASTNATRYEIEYEGSYNNSTWTTVQSFAASAYTSSTSQSVSWGSPKPAGGFDYYTYMRARVRATNTTSTVQVIGDNGSYIYAVGVAPGQPSFGSTITYNSAGTTATIGVSVGSSGSNYLYSPPVEYQYRASSGSYSGTWISSTTTISLTGLTSNTRYYIKIRTRNYDELVSPENEIFFDTPAGLSPATSTSISSVSRLNDTTIRAVIGSSGGSGPYYQQFWTSASSAPDPESRYDAASTTSTVTEDYGFNAGSTYYFYIRSSSENLGNTTTNGTGTSGTYSAYGPSTGAASYAFVQASGSPSISGSTTVGSSLTLTTSPSGSPTPQINSITWRRADGGPGGNSFTGGSVLQSGGTSYTIDSPVVGYSSVGYAIRAEVVYNNGLGVNAAIGSNSLVVTSSNLTAPNTPYNVIKSGSSYLVYFTGGSGPAYQVWWQGYAGTVTTTSYDASNGSSPITVNNLTASAGSTYYFAVRSVSSLSTTGSGPSASVSSWSGQYAYTEPSAPSTPAPVLSSLTGNNSLALGGTFNWSFTNSPTSYSILVTGPSGAVYTTSNLYNYYSTSFRPGYDGSGWQGAGNYTIYVNATNGQNSQTASLTTYMN